LNPQRLYDILLAVLAYVVGSQTALLGASIFNSRTPIIVYEEQFLPCLIKNAKGIICPPMVFKHSIQTIPAKGYPVFLPNPQLRTGFPMFPNQLLGQLLVQLALIIVGAAPMLLVTRLIVLRRNRWLVVALVTVSAGILSGQPPAGILFGQPLSWQMKSGEGVFIGQVDLTAFLDDWILWSLIAGFVVFLAKSQDYETKSKRDNSVGRHS
jgi:hypothetical protein